MDQRSNPADSVSNDPRPGSWREAVTLVRAVLQQLEERGHSSDRLKAVLRSLAEQGWQPPRPVLRVEHVERGDGYNRRRRGSR
jgi:hypothetical protein